MNKIETGRKVAIYGAGIYGKRVLDCFKINNIKVYCFIVTKKEAASPNKIEDIPVYSLDELNFMDFSEMEVYIAINEKYHKEIADSICNQYDKLDLKTIHYMKKEDIDRLYRDCNPYNINNFLSTTSPVSNLFGNDRGKPIDRYYIEKFLSEESKNMNDVNITLEVGEDKYIKKYFPNAIHEILDYSNGMDLTIHETIPKEKYDVFVCTQVFQQIYDVRAAIQGAWRLLKGGGILLATVCGNITKLARNEEYDHYWGFTAVSIEKLVREVFKNEVVVRAYGNAMAATAFVQGLAVEEVDVKLLDECNSEYAICISIMAKK